MMAWQVCRRSWGGIVPEMAAVSFLAGPCSMPSDPLLTIRLAAARDRNTAAMSIRFPAAHVLRDLRDLRTGVCDDQAVCPAKGGTRADDGFRPQVLRIP